jgi:GGDEF domain-containing protein
VSASFGAVSLQEAADPDHALALADAALYRAKAAR